MARSRASVISQVRAIVADLEEHVNNEVRGLMTALPIDLYNATPKDTTHAATNWIWSLTQRVAAAGSKKAVDMAAFRSGLQLAMSYSIQMGLAYLDNLVHYIKDLDEGWSPQARAGFIVMTIRKTIRGRIGQ